MQAHAKNNEIELAYAKFEISLGHLRGYWEGVAEGHQDVGELSTWGWQWKP